MAEETTDQFHRRNALVVYGSETGNSQDVADDLGRLVERLHFMTNVCEMDALKITAPLKFSLVIFVVSTTGQGEFPTNARIFWKSLLRKRLPPDCLAHLSFTTFGLGDSSYAHYNFSARKLHKRLQQLGAKEAYPRGEADDQHPEGIDGTYLPWSLGFRKHILASYPLPEGLTPIPPEVFLPPKFWLEVIEDEELDDRGEAVNTTTLSPLPVDDEPSLSAAISSTKEPEMKSSQGAPESHELWVPEPEPEPVAVCDQLREAHSPDDLPFECQLPPSLPLLPIPNSWTVKLLANKRMTPESHWQDVRELTFVMPEEESFFRPGDSLVIYPKNFPEDVDALISLMGWNTVADKHLKFKPEYPKFYADKWLVSTVPHLHPISRSTLRQLLLHNLDITAIPKRRFFEVIAQYTNNAMHRERLLELADPVFTDEFFDYTTRPRRSILEVLQDFPSVQLPWEWATTIFPVMRGRAYSIASGGIQQIAKVKKRVILTILVAIVKYRTVLRKVRRGLCSRYLASLPVGTSLVVTLHGETSFYKAARDYPELPVILVAAGTGIAPVRSLLWTRQHVKSRREQDVGPAFLFYGGRNVNSDYFYRREWEYPELQTTVFTAFSRDQPEKIYVQDIIREQHTLVSSLILDRNAIVFVCGSSGNMPKAVKEAFVYALICHDEARIDDKPLDREEALKILNRLERESRYVQETW